MYSLKTLFTQKPATIAATIGGGITAYQLLAEDNSVISDRAAMSIVGFLGLALALFWVDPSTININKAQDAKDEAFLAGLALPSKEDEVEAELKALAKKAAKPRKAPARRARGAAGATDLQAAAVVAAVAFALVLLILVLA